MVANSDVADRQGPGANPSTTRFTGVVRFRTLGGLPRKNTLCGRNFALEAPHQGRRPRGGNVRLDDVADCRRTRARHGPGKGPTERTGPMASMLSTLVLM